MADADVVITGTVLTVDHTRPTAEALAVADGRIIALGTRSDVAGFIGADTRTIDVGDGCVMPGFVEAHGHPLMEAMALSDRIVDIRAVAMRDADGVVDAIRREIAARGSAGAYLNGWDPLLQPGLPEPTLAWLDNIAPNGPLVIVHNSGHKAFFNLHAAKRAGLTRDTPDPKGARYGRDVNGELDGTAEETGAVFPLLRAAIEPSDYPALLIAECARLNRAGLTTCSEMAFDPVFRPLLEQLRGELTVRLRTYQIYYWGDVIVDGLFGPQRGSRWMPAGSAVATGMRISLHNDPPVTPEEPLRNISVAATRIAPSGRVLAPEERMTVEQAIRAQTVDAAWQLFADDVIGSLEVGKYADMVVLSADPRTVPPEHIADLEVRATFLAGRQVYRQ